MDKRVRQRILELSEEKYKKFMSGLCPGVENIAGVRMPDLRKLAKEIAGGEWQAFFEGGSEEYYEETMLKGMVIGYSKSDLNVKLKYAEMFIPKIDNWAVCDSFCGTLKFPADKKDTVWNFIEPYLDSDREFDVRYGLVMLLNYFVQDEYIDRALEKLGLFKHEGYYARMAAAWAVSACYVEYPEKTLDFIKSCPLDDFTYNKSIQKIIESLKVDEDTRNLMRSLRRRKL
jgi:3-methyladenine DNA glycosylase AlkD